LLWTSSESGGLSTGDFEMDQDVMSLAFHVWATVSLGLGAMFMSQLNQVRDKGPISGDIT